MSLASDPEFVDRFFRDDVLAASRVDNEGADTSFDSTCGSKYVGTKPFIIVTLRRETRTSHHKEVAGVTRGGKNVFFVLVILVLRIIDILFIYSFVDKQSTSCRMWASCLPVARFTTRVAAKGIGAH